MTGSPSAPAARWATAAATGRSLRVWGILILMLFLVTSTLGGSLAIESSYLPATLAGHIGLALVTLGFAGYVTSFAGRSYKVLPRASAGVSALSAIGATIAGTTFLVAGQLPAALYAMEGFAALGILSAVLMIAFGGPSGKRVPVASPR